MADEAGYSLMHVGDVDAFDLDAVSTLIASHPAAGVCCVHPMIAMRALQCHARAVGVFENANRAAEGEKPSFEAVSLHIVHAVFPDCLPALHEKCNAVRAGGDV